MACPVCHRPCLPGRPRSDRRGSQCTGRTPTGGQKVESGLASSRRCRCDCSPQWHQSIRPSARPEQLKRSRDGVQYCGRGGLEATLLQPGVVVDTDSCELSHLLATKSRHPASGSGALQTGLLRTQPGASALEELSRLSPTVHMRSIRPRVWEVIVRPGKV